MCSYSLVMLIFSLLICGTFYYFLVSTRKLFSARLQSFCEVNITNMRRTVNIHKRIMELTYTSITSVRSSSKLSYAPSTKEITSKLLSRGITGIRSPLDSLEVAMFMKCCAGLFARDLFFNLPRELNNVPLILPTLS